MTDCPHAPVHRLGGAERVRLLHDSLLDMARRYEWQLQAWAVLSNHCHFIALSPPNASSLSELVRRLHSATAAQVNRLDGCPGR